MASMPTYHVSTGPFAILNTKFGDPATCKAAYNSVLAPPKNGGPALGAAGSAAMTLQARAAQHEGAGTLSNGAFSHFLNDWLGGWWPNHSVADTLRQGMLEVEQRIERDMDPVRAAAQRDVDEVVRLSELRLYLEAAVSMSYQSIGYRRVKNPRIWSLHDLQALTDRTDD